MREKSSDNQVACKVKKDKKLLGIKVGHKNKYLQQLKTKLQTQMEIFLLHLQDKQQEPVQIFELSHKNA